MPFSHINTSAVGPLLDSAVYLRDISATLKDISSAVDPIDEAIAGARLTFWDGQLFAGIVGASFVFIGTAIKDYLGNRGARIKKLEDALMDSYDSFAPGSLVEKAAHADYGVPEKTLSEKTLIEFGRKLNYKALPWGKMKILLKRYQEALRLIPEGNAQKAKETLEFKKAVASYQSILDHLKAVTGENEWTIR